MRWEGLPHLRQNFSLSNKDCTLQLIDVPLNMKEHQIRDAFAAEGDIDRISIQNKGAKIYSTAYIQFTSPAPVSKYTKIAWQKTIDNVSMRAIPLSLSHEERTAREQHVLRLSGLPPKPNVYTFRNLIKETRAKAFIIPRSINNYDPRRMAFLYFEDANDKARAKAMTNISITFRNKPIQLYWMLFLHP